MTEHELERIRDAYEAREVAGGGPYRWDNPAYVLYMQALERALLRALCDARVSIQGTRILDVGCGSGYFLHRFQEYGARECHGIDLIETRIDRGRHRYPTLELKVGSATELPYADGAFDLVTQFTCLSSIADEEVRLAVGREMRRVARGGSILSFDIRRRRLLPELAGTTQTVPLDERDLVRLFGVPVVLRSSALDFGLAQRAGGHPLVASALAAVPLLRSHLLGVWGSLA